jgi:5'-3' exonuclease
MREPILVDCNSLAVRCIMAAAPDEIRHQLEFTGGMYGSLNILRRILESPKVNAGRVFACFDHSTPPRRSRLIPEYKQKRKERNQEELPREADLEEGEAIEVMLHMHLGRGGVSGEVFATQEQKEAAFSQVIGLRALLHTLGVVTLCYHNREADDIIGALAWHSRTDDSVRPLVVSSDRDLWQTVGWGCRVWDLHSHEIIDAANFHERTGVSTDTYLLYKALVGDTSDSIPGVHGLGPVKAGKLLEEAHWRVRVHREPRAQLAALCNYVGGKRKRAKIEDRLLRERRRLDRVLLGIDLRASFGPTDRLLDRLVERPEVDWRAFLRTCRQVGMSNVVGGHQRFVTPFRRAAGQPRKRRLDARKKRKP